jgi:tetratricopeptide (TPR) repeat protein
MTAHADDFTLLRYISGGVREGKDELALSHLAECSACESVVRELRSLDRDLRELAQEGTFPVEAPLASLGEGDPFARREPQAVPALRRFGPLAIPSAAEITATTRLVEANPREALLGSNRLALSEPAERLAIYYWMQELSQRITESASEARVLANAVLERVPPPGNRGPQADDPLLPWDLLEGQAHLLAAQADLWSSNFDSAGRHIEAAYSAFESWGDQTSIAIAELVESQRRSFTGRGEEALLLARRAFATFEELGLEELSAKAMTGQGLAWRSMGQYEHAIPLYRRALAVFARCELWSNYVSCVNSLATAFYKAGQLDEARREFAHALRKFSRNEHRTLQGFLRHGVAELLFSANKFREAAPAFARAAALYDETQLTANGLLATLAEAECWARVGDGKKATARIEFVRRRCREDASLDRGVVEALADGLASLEADAADISRAREHLATILPKY